MIWELREPMLRVITRIWVLAYDENLLFISAIMYRYFSSDNLFKHFLISLGVKHLKSIVNGGRMDKNQILLSQFENANIFWFG